MKPELRDHDLQALDRISGYDCPGQTDPLEESDYEKVIVMVSDFRDRMNRAGMISEQDLEGIEYFSNYLIDLMAAADETEIAIKAADNLTLLMKAAGFNPGRFFNVSRFMRRKMPRIKKDLQDLALLNADNFCREINKKLTELVPDIRMPFAVDTNLLSAAFDFKTKIIERSQTGIYGCKLMIRHFQDIERALDF